MSLSASHSTTIILLGVTVAISLLLFYHKNLAGSVVSWRFVLPLIRLASFAILLVLLADTVLFIPTLSRLQVVLIVDDSPSMKLADTATGKSRIDWSVEALTAAFKAESIGVQVVQIDKLSRSSLIEQLKDTVQLTEGSILVTDGFPSPTAATVAQGAAPGARPLYCALVPEQSLAPDISINRVEAPASMRLGVPARLSITLRALNAAGAETLVSVSDVGGTLKAQRIKIATRDETQRITIPITPQVAGAAEFVVRVASIAHEVNLANNEFHLSRQVVDEPLRVLLFESQPSWEAKFLRRALDNNPSIHLDYYAQVSKSAIAAQPSGQQGSAKLHKLLANKRQLYAYDTVIVGATEAGFLSAAENQNLKEFVENRGGGLIVLGSNNFSGSIIATGSPLVNLLPVAIEAKSLSHDAMDSASDPSKTGSSTPAGPQVVLESLSNEDSGDIFSPLLNSDKAREAVEKTKLANSFIRVSEIYPASHVLAELRCGSAAQREISYPAVVASDNGAGRVILLTPADLYRLNFATDSNGNPMPSFWQTLIYYSSAHATAAISVSSVSADGIREQVELVVRDSDYHATVVDQLTNHSSDLSATDAIAGSVSAPIFFQPDFNHPGRLTAEVDRLADRMDSLAIDGTAGPTKIHTEIILPLKDAGRQMRPLPEARSRLLSLFGEENIFSLDRGASLAAQLARQIEHRPRTREHLRLTDHIWIWLLVPLLLSVEFYLRRRMGLD